MGVLYELKATKEASQWDCQCVSPHIDNAERVKENWRGIGV
jgi:hypothetical protein